MTQLEKPTEPARSLDAAQRDHAVVTVHGTRMVARQLAVARATRRGMEAYVSMRGGGRHARQRLGGGSSLNSFGGGEAGRAAVARRVERRCAMATMGPGEPWCPTVMQSAPIALGER
jgi:hypothetical protein